MGPLVSTVIVNHNYGRYIGECIESVLAQTYQRIETIVVDDGSTDDSMGVLRSYKNRITVVSQSNKGPSAARNAGIARSTGEWIALLDSDDVWLPEKIQEQSKYFHEDSVGLILCGLEWIDVSGIRLEYSDPTFATEPLRQLVTFTNPTVGCSTAVVRADFIRRIGPFDETLRCGEDLDLWIRIAAEYEIRTIPAILGRCRRHPGSLSQNVGLFEENNSKMLNKVFSNPACGRVHHLRRQGFGKLYVILAGAYCHDRKLRQAACCALRAILYWPLEIGYICQFPIRVLRRLLASTKSGRHCAG